MRDRITAAASRAVSTFKSFSAGQKAVTIVAVLALAIGGYFFSTWASTPTYAPLFSNLATEDAAAIVEKLTAAGTPYKLTGGGTTIMVPQDKVYDLRLQMSGEGLPAGGDTGYSLLDKQNVMTSEFMQQVGYRRAMEGELAKTIKSIDGVKAATVHLAIPQKDVFTDDQKKPTASVLVATSPTKTLRADQVQAVVNLVASSVEGMEPSSVTVVGADGTVLSTGNGDAATGGSAVTDQRTRSTREYEQRLGTSLQRMLDQVVGAGNAVVQITADLDFDATETKTQKYVADKNVPPLAETTKTEKYSNGASSPTAGVLGPDNIQVPGGTTGGAYENSTETRNNAVGVVTEVRKSAPGAVRRLSVAVMLNEGVKGADDAQMRQLISSAVGLDSGRGDSIAVSTLAFDKSVAEATAKELAEAEKAEKTEELYSMIKTGAAVAGVVLLVMMAFISGRRRNKKLQKMLKAEVARFSGEQAELAATRTPALAGAGTGGAIGGNAAAGELEAAPTATIDEEAKARADRQKEVAAMVEQQPEEVATLLRSWLADRRG
jgi:flagellar M-ring protein FliF